ncbi:hypothetical protein BASA81_005320 [Batrachochytrium salamandrivorans]|nr:hypothetical protein BASA81_005320 [Batrachochytrium salamandrivorans]
MSREKLSADYLNKVMLLEIRKKSGAIVSWGTKPFYKRDEIIIPHGFMLESKFQGHTIRSETKVEDDAGFPILSYQFSSVSDNVQGGFYDNPTKALASLAKALALTRHPFDNFNNEAGPKHVGVTYAKVQRLLEAFHKEEDPSKRQQQEGSDDGEEEEAVVAKEEEEEAPVADEEAEEAPVADEEAEEAPVAEEAVVANEETKQLSAGDSAKEPADVQFLNFGGLPLDFEDVAHMDYHELFDSLQSDPHFA